MDVCTIVARNYEAHARVLVDSLKRIDPGCRVWVLIVDDVAEAVEAGGQDFEVLRPRDLPLSTVRFHAMAAVYDVTELATAVKPWLLRHILDRGASSVLYLDPDIEVYASLEEVVRLTEEHGVVLTPHCLEPLPLDGLRPSDVDILAHGLFNLGFIGVGPAALGFLDWWEERLERHCVAALDEGLYVDQRWVDMAVQQFPHHVLRDEGCNVAWWNLDARTVTAGPDGWAVNGRPLRFFHFSSFDPHRPEVVSRHRTRRTSDDDPAVQDLLAGHAKNLLGTGWDETRGVPYAYGASCDGTPLTPALRARFRHKLLYGRPDEVPPDPFDPLTAPAFTRWARNATRRMAARTLRENATHGAGRWAGLARSVVSPLSKARPAP